MAETTSTISKKEAALEVLTISLTRVVAELYKAIKATFATKEDLQAATGASPEPATSATEMWNDFNY